MIRKNILSGCILFGLLLAISCGTPKGPKCDPDHVWVPGYKAANGEWVDGWCRPAAKPGHVWVSGHTASNGRWVPGHWKPAGPGHYKDNCGPGREWVPGHRGRRGRWISGHCK